MSKVGAFWTQNQVDLATLVVKSMKMRQLYWWHIVKMAIFVVLLTKM